MLTSRMHEQLRELVQRFDTQTFQDALVVAESRPDPAPSGEQGRSLPLPLALVS